MNARAYKQYKETQVLTASPLRLVLLCYDGAITAIKKARQAEEQRDFAVRDKELNRASSLVSELLAALREEGGQITANLKSLYVYVLKMLLDASVNNDPNKYEEALKVMSDLKEAWQKLAEGDLPEDVMADVSAGNAAGAAAY